MLLRITLATLAPAVLCFPAYSHPAHGMLMSVGSGFGHPLLGLDHLLVMLAVGMWARLVGGRAVWALPVAFILAMIGGFALGVCGVKLPAAELGIAASVVLLGALVAGGSRLPVGLSASLIAPFAVLHGHAHASGLTDEAVTFGLGLVLATSLLHAAGILLGRYLGEQHPRAIKQGVGGAVAAVGLVLLGGGS